MTETAQPAALIRCLTAKDDAAASKQTSRPDSQMMGPEPRCNAPGTTEPAVRESDKPL
jgi:hypothetical protein